MTGWRGGLPDNPRGETPGGGPCGAARAEVDIRCADAERLMQANEAHQHDVREMRHQLDDLARMHEGDARVRDRRQLADEKAAAQRAYNRALETADDEAAVRDAAAMWLHQIDQLNRRARIADQRADRLAHELAEVERKLPGLELAADTARIAAEAAHQACVDARRALAACEEEAQRRLAGVQPATAPAPTLGVPPAPVAGAEAGAAAPAGVPLSAGPAQLGEGAWAVLRGDRQAMLALALRLAEETGIEAGRLQLLLLELRASVAARALEAYAVRFPPQHPFWGQFPTDAAMCVAKSMGSMGYRFDGLNGWADGRAPGVRDLALALSYCGYDHRSLRRPASQAAIDVIWEGTVVLVEDFLLHEAPELTLPEMVICLGPHADRLGELWDIWGRLRPLLLRPG